ncbi:MAG: diphosphomevalonate decarboxylase [candidate division Zixibacteria bacterium]|nr:diphosphomevalonate decarboxylase [candidate division Zixibacteria bacterium]
MRDGISVRAGRYAVIKRVHTRAFSNIALIKYWGKVPGGDNIPATPSISIALRELSTETEVERFDVGEDRVFINGVKATDKDTERITSYLDMWRELELIEGNYSISSRANFPIAAGLASSASGFAALAKALAEFSRIKLGKRKLSQLARRGSGSAARSVTGGLSAFPVGKDPAARLLIDARRLSYGMVAITVDSARKKISSREGMEHTRQTSPFYNKWIKLGAQDYKEMLRAINLRNLTRIGELMESNTLAMHSCIMSARPPIVYWSPATIYIIQKVRSWRDEGLDVYFTIDAGANVFVLCMKDDMDLVASKAEKLQGVVKVIKSEPGGGAEVISRQ